VSALDALVEAAGPAAPDAGGLPVLRAAWMDAQRGEVYGRLYRPAGSLWQPVGQPVVGSPSGVLAGWADSLDEAAVEFVGNGAVAYGPELERALGARARVSDSVPPLAPAIASAAAREEAAGLAVPPDAVRPLYVRRPDAELARERRGQGPL
jgi:tRNA A37 threonylcarbamoyladenosine modification protein TsaB